MENRQKNRYGIKLLLSSFMMILCTVSYGQTVTGIVKDKATKQPIAGVTVIVLGTSNGTTTSIEGKYTIKIPADAEKTLVFSYIGYKSDTIAINNRTKIDVLMSEIVSELDEVVVVGYGTMRKSDLTGALTSVKIQEEEAASVTSFEKLLQGRAAGVQVTMGNNSPGGATSVVIRGGSSFNSVSEPLYVVDGIILNPSSQDVEGIYQGTANNQESQNPLLAINPQDIVSIEVLKDASATAIYGSQGANGVILITTKSGSTDKPRIEVSSTTTLSHRVGSLGMLGLDGYRQWRQEVYDLTGEGVESIPAADEQEVDWIDESTRLSVSTTNRISVSGSTDKGKYFVSGGFSDNNGIIRQTNSQVSDFRVNVDQTLAKWLDIGTKTSFAITKIDALEGAGGTGSLNNSMSRQMVLSVPYRANTNNDLNDDNILDGPEAWFAQYTDRSNDIRFIPSVYADFKIFKWLSFRTTAGLDLRIKERTRVWGPELQVGSRDGDNGRGGSSQLRAFKYNIDNMLNYNFDLGRGHYLSGVMGVVANYSSNETTVITGENFTNSNYGENGLNLAQRPIQTRFKPVEYSIFSALTRAIYNYKDRYTITATFRADGSSKFSTNNKFAYFPSFAVAWRLSEEPFIKKLSFIDNIKIRAGWGQVGNQNLTPYQTLATYTSVSMADPNNNDAILTGYVPAKRHNPTLKWEISQQVNLGLDFGFFNNRIMGTIDVYNKVTKDLLQTVKLPFSSGFTTMWANRGSIENKGLEISLDFGIIAKKDFNLNIGGNISFNRNKILDAGVAEDLWGTSYVKAFAGNDVLNSGFLNTYVNIFMEGKPMGLFYGFKTKGIIQEGNDDNPPTFNNTAGTNGYGSVFYVDQNNDGTITEADRVIIGNPNPDFTGGFYLSANYKNLSLSLNFTGVYGNDILNANLVPENDLNTTNNVRAEAYYNAWREGSTNATYPGLTKSAHIDQMYASDRLIEDGSYLRLSNVSLSYKFRLKRVPWIETVGISISARNLFCITNYSGWDPDADSFNNDPLRMGIDCGSFPSFRSFTFGINLTF